MTPTRLSLNFDLFSFALLVLCYELHSAGGRYIVI
jgi:hypothetical protein